MRKVVEVRDEVNENLVASLDALAREGARRMIAAALEVEVEEYVRRFTDERDECGHALVVRNGRGQERKMTIGSGTMPLRAPRVNDKRVVDGKRQKFTSKILPPYLRRSRNVTEVLPVLCSRAAGLAMAYKLMLAAERTWRCLDGAELLPVVRAGSRFVDGKQQERKEKPMAKRQHQQQKVAA